MKTWSNLRKPTHVRWHVVEGGIAGRAILRDTHRGDEILVTAYVRSCIRTSRRLSDYVREPFFGGAEYAKR
jgi:hypothetical protein